MREASSTPGCASARPGDSMPRGGMTATPSGPGMPGGRMDSTVRATRMPAGGMRDLAPSRMPGEGTAGAPGRDMPPGGTMTMMVGAPGAGAGLGAGGDMPGATPTGAAGMPRGAMSASATSHDEWNMDLATAPHAPPRA